MDGSDGQAAADGQSVNEPSVSVVVPCRNEAGHIEEALASILRQEEIPGGMEVLVADGMSDDGTREILQRIAREDARLRVIDNPGRIVPTGLNAAIRASRGEIVVRMDAHTEYAPDYVAQCVTVLQATGADNVGGPWRAAGKSWLQQAIALAFQSPFSSGGAGSHDLDYEGAVDSVYLGCWKKSTLERLGLFDEELVRNQDDELNLRLVRAGGRVWQSPQIRSCYYPRSSLKALFRQYSQYGYWKVRVIRKHRLPASFRHLVPGAFVASLFVLSLMVPFFGWAAVMLSLLVGLYLLLTILASLVTCRHPENRKYAPIMPIVFAAYHLGYGWGFLRGVVDFLLLRRGGGDSFKTLTRKG